MRNIEKNIAQGAELMKKHPLADMKFGELVSMKDDFYKDLKEYTMDGAIMAAITKAFLFGAAVGSRNASKGR